MELFLEVWCYFIEIIISDFLWLLYIFLMFEVYNYSVLNNRYNVILFVVFDKLLFLLLISLRILLKIVYILYIFIVILLIGYIVM